MPPTKCAQRKRMRTSSCPEGAWKMSWNIARLAGRCKVGSNISILRIFSLDELRARPCPFAELPPGGRDGSACAPRAHAGAAVARTFKLLLVCAREISTKLSIAECGFRIADL